MNASLAMVVAIALSVPAQAAEVSSAQLKENKTGLFQDIFDAGYYDLTSYLHLDRFYRLISRSKLRAANVNVFEEVLDSLFFTNRHGRKRLTLDELKKGARVTEGPSPSGDITITNGKFEGLHPGFFVTDSKSDKYLLKFDDIDLFELETSGEVIGSLFYHAFGYNVPEYNIAVFSPGRLVPGPDSKTVDDTGFRKELTPERLEEYLLFLPEDSDGNLRASASKILPGENKGNFNFQGRRKNDPNDVFDHKEMREIRALRVFGSWLNNFDTRESNTLDMVQDVNGQKVLKHYVIDFNASLGRGILFPMFTFEHILDFGEGTKAFFGFGLWEKTWQKRWREAGREVTRSPAVGDFDNRYFNPGKFKLQLPHYAMKDLTNADGFWAAKIIMSFTDEEITAMVAEGKLSAAEDAQYVSQVLSERRDIIGKYWFVRVNPLDAIDLKGSSLEFTDLGVQYGFNQAAGTQYHAKIYGRNGSHSELITTLESANPGFDLSPWLAEYTELSLKIRTSRASSKKLSPPVIVTLSSTGITGIKHKD